MEHNDWNEYHAAQVAKQQKDAQPEDATQQSFAQEAPQNEPRPMEQTERGRHFAHSQAEQVPDRRAADADQPVEQPATARSSDSTDNQAPPTSWDYDSTTPRKSKRSARDERRNRYTDAPDTTPTDADAPNDYAMAQDAAPQQHAAKKGGKRGRTALVIVIVVLAVVAIAAIIYLLTSGTFTSSDASSDTENAETSVPVPDVDEDLASALSELAAGDVEEAEEAEEETEAEEEVEYYTFDDASYNTMEEFLESFGTFEEVTVSGKGSEIIDLPVPDGPMLITATADDDSNTGWIFVSTLDEDGDTLAYFNTGTTPYSGTATNLTSYGIELGATQVQIDASSDSVEWTLTFSPMNTMEPLENGTTYTTGGVYYIEDADIESFTINYDAYDDALDPTFTASVISSTGYSTSAWSSDSIAGQTEQWAEPLSVVIIDAPGGEWSISW